MKSMTLGAAAIVATSLVTAPVASANHDQFIQDEWNAACQMNQVGQRMDIGRGYWNGQWWAQGTERLELVGMRKEPIKWWPDKETRSVKAHWLQGQGPDDHTWYMVSDDRC
jgi:hypothetical protein